MTDFVQCLNRISLKQLLFSETALLFTALLSFLILFWGFVVATALHHVIISNTSAAYVLWSIPQAVTSIVTPISTCFSVIIGVLYTRSLRLAARKSLTNALEIRSLVGWNALMGKRVIGMPFGTGSRWAKFALVSWFLLTTLTTGFNAFITPQKLPQVRSLETFGELDMSTDAFLYNLYTPMSGNVSRDDDLSCLRKGLITVFLSSCNVNTAIILSLPVQHHGHGNHYYFWRLAKAPR